jgi:hypothetical protein
MKNLLLTVLLVYTGTYLHGQCIDAQFKAFRQLAYEDVWLGGWSGGALEMTYRYQVTPNDALLGGAELGFVSWGNQLLFNLGYERRWSPGIRGWLSASTYLSNGFAFFRPDPLYVGGFGVRGGYSFLLGKKLALGFYTGVRYYASPGYGDFSSINSYWDMPIEMHVHFGKRKPTSSAP